MRIRMRIENCDFMGESGFQKHLAITAEQADRKVTLEPVPHKIQGLQLKFDVYLPIGVINPYEAGNEFIVDIHPEWMIEKEG